MLLLNPQPVVSDAFRAAFGVEDIDGHRTAGHGRGAEGPSVERSDDGEEHQRSRDEVSGEEQREAEVADQQDLLAGEAVDDEAAERPHAQRRQGVAAQYDADHGLSGREGVAQVERQQRCQQIECKEQHEIGDPHLHVVAVPQNGSLLSGFCFGHDMQGFLASFPPGRIRNRAGDRPALRRAVLRRRALRPADRSDLRTSLSGCKNSDFVVMLHLRERRIAVAGAGRGYMPPPFSNPETVARPCTTREWGGRSVVCQTLPPITVSCPIRTRPRIDELE